MSTVVVKVGTSSITNDAGDLDDRAMVKLCADLVDARRSGHRVVLVTSGAISAGLPALGMTERPSDVGELQAVAAVGQPRLMERVSALLGSSGVVAGQVLLTPFDFGHRTQYLHARSTLQRLLDLGVLPVVNENDTVADDEIRYGDNDRLAALVAHLVDAESLVLLTDTPGLFTADPRIDAEASLIEEIVEVDEALEAVAGGAGTERGSGGMASKLAAAKIASWSGVQVVITAADTPGAVKNVLDGNPSGTVVHPHERRLPSRKLWIAFARASAGRIVVDNGARDALVDSGRSLLSAGVRSVEGSFEVDDAVEIVDPAGRPFAKGLVRYASRDLAGIAGRRTDELGDGRSAAVVHRDDLVVLP